MPNPSDNLRFDIHPSIVFQLGESLVSDVVQALVELVKNAYDADADYAKITINTKENNYPLSKYKNSLGFIAIEDNGFGMDDVTIQRGWLTISNSLKRNFKEEKKTTPRGRTPLGDKGVGRLGVQKLGNNVEIFTRPKNSEIEYYVAFSWNDFFNVEKLGDVHVTKEERFPSNRNTGTTIVVSDLKDLNYWKGNAILKLQNELSRVISPFKEIRDFIIYVSIDGEEVELAEIDDTIRNAAQLKYKLNFDGEVLIVKGRARLDYCEPPDKKEDIPLFRQLVEKDAGKNFFNFLSTKPKAKMFNLIKSDSEGWFVEYDQQFKINDLDRLKLINKYPANPGPFYAEIDYFDFDKSFNIQSIFDKTSEYRNYIKDLSGIRVYRDGFAIRVEHDWLRLGQQQTGATSFYGLRPGNTLGYIALTARNNFVLEEKTDREGFQDNPYFQNFYEMLQKFVGFSLQAQEFIRRGWNDFKKDNQIQKVNIINNNVNKNVSLEEVIKHIYTGLDKSKVYSESLNKVKQNLEKASKNSEEILNRNTNNVSKDEVSSIFNSLKNSIKEARDCIVQIENYMKEMESLSSYGQLLSLQVQGLREQLEQFYEMVSLGLTAEALSHEINNIADNLADRTNNVNNHLKQIDLKDSKLVSYIEYVKTGISGLRKQLSHFSPSLKYVRDKKEVIDLNEYFNEVKDYYSNRFQKNNIQIEFDKINSNKFSLYMNKGKLSQIIDNLLLNSEYWLREDIRLLSINEGIITIDIDKPYIRISDNGRGIEPSIELTLFEPFVTTKGTGKGRGLGLFVVQQFLDSEGCSIMLLSDRNVKGRLYIFEIDLTGGLYSNV
jgi:signal transduction histidine kinase